jgi:hypothetical protein
MIRNAFKRVKPAWISGEGALALLFQSLLASLVLYAVTANHLGYISPKPGAPPLDPILDKLAAPWAMLALVAVTGIWRNRWWGYLLELLVIWALVAAVIWNPVAPEPRKHILFEIPILSTFAAVFSWIVFAYQNWYLLKTGHRLYREQAAPAIHP